MENLEDQLKRLLVCPLCKLGAYMKHQKGISIERGRTFQPPVPDFYISIDDHQEVFGNNNVAGNSNHVEPHSKLLEKVIAELGEVRKLLAESMRYNREQTERFFHLIEKMHFK